MNVLPAEKAKDRGMVTGVDTRPTWCLDPWEGIRQDPHSLGLTQKSKMDR